MVNEPNYQTGGPLPSRHAFPVTLCASFCEAAAPDASASGLQDALAATCLEAGFPHCERVYAGSYFCENYFCGLADAFHEAMRELCATHDMRATLVVPIFGQAFLNRGERRLVDVLERFGDVYDEVIVNDVGEFLHLASLAQAEGKRIGLGRLFSKVQRDARYPDIAQGTATPTLSAEALACLDAIGSGRAAERERVRPLVEIDPVAAVVDASRILDAQPDAEVAVHLPLCYATTGRLCSAASIGMSDGAKFLIGRGCAHQCLDVVQGFQTEEGASYVKHGRTVYFSNPSCEIAGVESWRVVYAAAFETMRPARGM